MWRLYQRMANPRSIELDNAFYVEDGEWIESLTIAANGPFDVEALVADLPGVEFFFGSELPTASRDVEMRRVTIVANESYPFVLGLILRQEVIPNRIVLQSDAFEVVATARDFEQFQTLADEIRATLGDFELRSVTQDEDPGEPLDSGRLKEVLVSKLSDDQLSVLETAYTNGYFEIPRESSETEIAADLGVAQSTLSERLRTAERALLELIYGPR